MVLASYQSQPVTQDLRVINKVSQNLHAELMLRLLGKEKGTSGSIEGGLEVLRGFLVNAGIKADQFVFYDGSGLSREDLVTPQAIVDLCCITASSSPGDKPIATPCPSRASMARWPIVFAIQPPRAWSTPKPARWLTCIRWRDMPPRSRVTTSRSQ